MTTRATRVFASILIVLTAIGSPAPALAYLKLGVHVGSRTIALQWRAMPVRYFVTGHGVSGVTAQAFEAALWRAFQQWEAVETSSIAYQFGGFTSALPIEEDGLSTIGFLEMPELDRVLASTNFIVDDLTGDLIESDIFFNAAFDWSTSERGEAGRFDVESIALHEIGHMSGLGHSGLGETEVVASGGRRVLATEAVMFPIAFPAGVVTNRTLRPDDVAGMSDLYPDNGFTSRTGSVSGQVTKNGRGVYGAHVTAFNPWTGALVGNFTLDAQGKFSIAGLAPGSYVIRVEPIDDTEVDAFFDPNPPADVNFSPTYYGRLAVVPKGGDSGSLSIRVVPK